VAAQRVADAPTKLARLAATMNEDTSVLSERKGASMTRSRPIGFLAAAAVPLVALAAAGCGSSNPTATVKPASGSSATVNVANTALGKILVDSRGRTLYLFVQDTGTKSTCSGGCATAWPSLRASGKPTAGGGAKASLLGTTPRSDGKPQVTYNGHPLYGYQGDSKAGDLNGQGVNGFGAPWFVLSPSGNQITTPSTSSGGGTNGY
jgi:predicted lipoprotein with Yx(FWY)xxD motif